MPWNSKKYARINWKNRPSTATALGATNLNKMDVFLNEVDNYLITMDAGKLDITTANGLLKTLEIDVKTGKIKATELGGTEHEWDLNLEKIPVSFSLQSDGTLVMTTDDGTEFEANLADAIRDYEFEDTDTIGFTKDYDEPGQEGNYNNKGTYTVKANVKPGSIKAEHLDPDWRADVQQFKNDAETAASSSLQYSKDSKRWAVGDESYPGSDTGNAKAYKELAESYAHGGTGTREGEEEDNAKKYAEIAEEWAKKATEISAVDIMTPTLAGIGKPDDVTLHVTEDGTLSAQTATESLLGVVKPDNVTIKVDESGTLSTSLPADFSEKTTKEIFERFYGMVNQETEFMPDRSIVTTSEEATLTATFQTADDGVKTITERLVQKGDGGQTYVKTTTITPAATGRNKKIKEVYSIE